MSLSNTSRKALEAYLDHLPYGTTISVSAKNAAKISGTDDYLSATLIPSHCDSDWIGIDGNSVASRVSDEIVAEILSLADPTDAARVVFGALSVVHSDNPPAIEEGDTYIRRSADDSWAVRVADRDLGNADGERLPLNFEVSDPLAQVPTVYGTVDGAHGEFLLLGDGSGRRVNVYNGILVGHGDIEDASEEDPTF